MANYKYIKREWKNGKWVYTYETDSGAKGYQTPNNPVKKNSAKSPQTSKASTVKNTKSLNTSVTVKAPGVSQRATPAPIPKEVSDDQTAVRKTTSASRDIKNTKPTVMPTNKSINKNNRPKDVPDDQEAATRAYDSLKNKQRPTANQPNKTTLAKDYVKPVKTAMSPSSKSAKNEPSFSKRLKTQARDAFGYDEKDAYEQAKTNLKAEEHKLAVAKRNRDLFSKKTKTEYTSEDYDTVTRLDDEVSKAEKAVKKAKTEAEEAERNYSKTMVAKMEKGRVWLNDIFKKK